MTDLHTPTQDSQGHPKQSEDAPMKIHHWREGKQHAYDVAQLSPIPKTRSSSN